MKSIIQWAKLEFLTPQSHNVQFVGTNVAIQILSVCGVSFHIPINGSVYRARRVVQSVTLMCSTFILKPSNLRYEAPALAAASMVPSIVNTIHWVTFHIVGYIYWLHTIIVFQIGTSIEHLSFYKYKIYDFGCVRASPAHIFSEKPYALHSFAALHSNTHYHNYILWRYWLFTAVYHRSLRSTQSHSLHLTQPYGVSFMYS